MLALRSLLFNLLFFAWTTILCLMGLPLLALPRGIVVFFARVWATGIAAFLATIVGTRHEVRGIAPSGRPVIYAFKHQSAWETVLLPILVPDPATVLKCELLFVPIFGWYLLKTGQLPIDRGGGGKALKALLRAARARVAEGRSIVIFPEGTRMPPGQHRPYQPGVAALYGQLGLPVIPVALNSGLFWARRGFLKRPGRIAVEFLPPIEPGLSRYDFVAELERRTEEACARLLAETTNGEDG